MGERNWFPVRQHFEINLAPVVPANKREHAAIRREGRLGYRIGELGELNPLRAVGQA